jgi:NAD(P)-dependent dehydrogenase (short-subunit alcohol dehydrogenase family)
VAWSPADIPDLRGRAVLVTGANSGLGLESARELAAHGAHTLLACRRPDAGRAAAEEIRAGGRDARLDVVELDLADLASIERAARDVAQRVDRLELLVNNAGIMAVPRGTTADGFERHFGVNHLGHFALTGRLLPLLVASATARVVTVTSGMHHGGWMRFSDPMGERFYNRWLAYGQSKLANLLFTVELHARLAARHPQVVAVASHPGYVTTNLQRGGGPVQRGLLSVAGLVIGQPARRGAWPTLYAATAPDVEGGQLFGPRALVFGSPHRAHRARRATDEDDARRLWALSESLTGVRYLSD